MKRLGRHLRLAAAAGAAVVGLTACVHDTAAYVIGDDRQHAITLIRSQNWFWKDTVNVAIVTARMPDCQGGLSVPEVPRSARIELFQPEQGGYPEPIHILRIEGIHYAASTVSCRVQRFEQPPAEPGQPLGVFAEEAGEFRFSPAPEKTK